jgi:CheY-like chemotaxis protein
MLVALTGYGMHHDVEEAHAAGFDDHLTKPTDLQHLEDLVAKGKIARKVS